MRTGRRLLRSLLGSRLPTTTGAQTVAGLHEPVRIDRDRFGIPVIEASGEEDAYFGLGYCQGQDRAFQLELLRRAVRGALAELLGPPALPVDRMARRVDFRRCADETLAADAEAAVLLDAFTRGLNAGAVQGLPRRPHELALLRTPVGLWDPSDVVGLARLIAFMLPSNWDQELVRLKMVVEDGPEAVQALDGPYPPEAPAHDAPGAPAGTVPDPLLEDLAAFTQLVRLGGASNAWAVSGERTVTGQPLLAGDPHLSPTVPAHWYLAHLRTPGMAVAGATLAGTPSVLAGHNSHGAWSLTIAPLDTSDLVLERLEGDAVRRGTARVPCRARSETIAVRGAEPVEITALEAPEGPIISPELPDSPYALALQATWLRPHPVAGLLTGLQRASSFTELREHTRDWAGLPVNFVWASRDGTIGWQTAGRVPNRRRGHGIFPTAGWDADSSRSEDLLAFDELPWHTDPQSGYLVSANHLPTAGDDVVRFGRDWQDGYRARRIELLLARRTDWDVAGFQRLQLDDVTLSWWELRDAVLAAPVRDDDALLGRELLAAWGGRLGGPRPGATVFAFLVAELTGRLVRAAAPRTARWALGATVSPLSASNAFPKRYRSMLVRRIRDHDPGPLGRPWPEEIAEALGSVVATLRARYGPDPAGWGWDAVARWEPPHVLGRRQPLDRVFNLEPLRGAGDQTTVAQHNRSFEDPSLPPLSYPSLRFVVDLSDWDASRFALPGGQSGNPLSPHYDDQLPAYCSGAGVPIPWSPEARRRAVRSSLLLEPDRPRASPRPKDSGAA